MLIIALVLAVIGLAALVTAVVTSNEVIAWVCIAASVLGVLLLIIDAIRERQRREAGVEEVETGDAAEVDGSGTAEDTYQTFDSDYPEDDEAAPVAEEPVESADLDEAETGEGSDESVEAEEIAEDAGAAETEETVDSTAAEDGSEAHDESSDESDTAAESGTEGEAEPESAEETEEPDDDSDRAEKNAD